MDGSSDGRRSPSPTDVSFLGGGPHEDDDEDDYEDDQPGVEESIEMAIALLSKWINGACSSLSPEI